MKSLIKTDTEVLNELLRMNNDRVEYYQNVSEKSQALNLKNIFNGMADESEKNASALIREIIRSGIDTIGHTTTIRSKFYRFQMNVKALFARKDSQSILDSCIPNEDAAQTAYYNAISSNQLTMQARQLIRNQQVALKVWYDRMMAFRNESPVLMFIGL